MASTFTVQSVVNWAQTQIRLAPLTGVGGQANEPALTIANDVLQDVFAFPNAWKFNRQSLDSFQTIAYQQEYTAKQSNASVTNIGFLERVTFEDTNNTATPKPVRDGEVVFSIPKESYTDNPFKICVDRETATDSILRVWPVPGTYVWTVYTDFQAKAPILTALTQTFAPWPDELIYVIRSGFLYFAYLHLEDPRAPMQYQIYQANLAKARGIKDAEPQNEGFFPTRSIMWG